MGISSPVALLPCAFLERATAHVLLGWLPKVVDLEVKLALGRQQHQAMIRAIRLEELIRALRRMGKGCDLSIPRRWRDRMEEIDRSSNEKEMLERVYLEVKPALASIYRRLLASLDPVADAPLLALIAPAASDHDQLVGWAEQLIGAARRTRPRGWSDEADEPRYLRKHWLWRPFERVPTAARPVGLTRHPSAGATAIRRQRPSQRSAAFLLHHNTDAELTTMELFARCSYEHPEMPEAFHRDMSRQTSDESRHAQACMELAARHGAPHGTWPTSTVVYDLHYQFPTCRAGSKRELLWRLLLRSTVEEALSLDGFAPLSARLAHDGALDAARVIESIMADEVFHVEAGLKWSRFLCGGDDDRVFHERATAHQYYVSRHVEARRRYVADRPDEAIREAEELQRQRAKASKSYPFDLGIHLATEARTRIGFTRRDLDQVVAWGYARR